MLDVSITNQPVVPTEAKAAGAAPRKHGVPVRVGAVVVGGGAPVVV